MNSLMRQWSTDIHHAPSRMGNGNAITPTFRSARRSIMFAALSASIRNGIGQVLPSVRRVRMNPGHTTQTRIPSGASIPRRASPHVLTQLFVAEYAGHALSGPYPAIEAVMTICGLPGIFPPSGGRRLRNNSIAGRTVLTQPPTFIANVRRELVSVSSPVETPAFANTRSSGDSSSHALSQRRVASSSATSRTCSLTVAPIFRQASATATRRSALRPQRKSLSPRFAQASASASPTPELAPVISVLTPCCGACGAWPRCS